MFSKSSSRQTSFTGHQSRKPVPAPTPQHGLLTAVMAWSTAVAKWQLKQNVAVPKFVTRLDSARQYLAASIAGPAWRRHPRPSRMDSLVCSIRSSRQAWQRHARHLAGPPACQYPPLATE
jgi:hypothetical protein